MNLGIPHDANTAACTRGIWTAVGMAGESRLAHAPRLGHRAGRRGEQNVTPV